MNTPTPTPRTDAATYPADCLGKTLVTNRDCSRALETELVTLTGAYTCTHHNDQQRAACPVCLVTKLRSEVAELKALSELDFEMFHAIRMKLTAACGDPFKLVNEALDALIAERDQLRADCENETKWAAHYLAESIAVKAERDQLLAALALGQENCDDVYDELRGDCDELRGDVVRLTARAERADADLAAERERVRVLRNALENLCDEQNGAPLETRRDQWEMVMNDARAALATTEGAK
jgi:hypothetical protein